MRIRHGFVVVVFLVLLVRLWDVYVYSSRSAYHQGVLLLQQMVLKTQLRNKHHFWPSSQTEIQLDGRWNAVSGSTVKVAGFPGSRARFTVQNTTSIFIVLNNNRAHKDTQTGHNSRSNAALEKLGIHVSFGAPHIPGPVPLLIKVNGIAKLFFPRAHGILQVSRDLDSTHIHEIEVILAVFRSTKPDVLHFKSLLLDRGGRITAQHQDACRVHLGKPVLSTNLSPVEADSHNTDISTSKNEIGIEIVGTEPFILPHLGSGQFPDLIHENSYYELLERSSLFNATTTLLPLPSGLCLTADCGAEHTSKSSLSIADLYFRSGPIGTPLFGLPWPWPLRSYAPSSILLDIGFSDFQSFFSEYRSRLPYQSSTQPGQRELDTFVSNFVKSYVDFILTIRRTTPQFNPRPRPCLNEYDSLDSPSTQPNSHTSTPSTTPIFVLIPVLPPSYDGTLTRILYNALEQVVSNIRKIEGDKNTFLIDTSGWLDNSDFETIPRHDKRSTSTMPVDADEIDKTSLKYTHAQSLQSQPRPKGSGHRKLANFLSVYFCPYLSPRPDENCPLERMNEYTGNLYIPDEVRLGKAMQERKIARVKEVLGWL